MGKMGFKAQSQSDRSNIACFIKMSVSDSAGDHINDVKPEPDLGVEMFPPWSFSFFRSVLGKLLILAVAQLLPKLQCTEIYRTA